jgi:cytidine deaminase
MRSDQEITEAITARMWERRKREALTARAKFTMCYAVSVTTGSCYVGYNMKEFYNKTLDGTGTCAENRAVYVALSYGEALESLVLFALNKEGEYFNACQQCQEWVWQARGFLRYHKSEWRISTARCIDGNWKDKPLTDEETETLYQAGSYALERD